MTLNRRFEDIDRVIGTLYHETKELLPTLQNALAGSHSALRAGNTDELKNLLHVGTQSFNRLERFVGELERVLPRRTYHWLN